MLEPGQRHRSESGLTLVELLVVVSIFGILLSGVYGVLIIVQRQTADISTRADAVDQARLALDQIDRQVRSGNVLIDPVVDQSAWPLSMRVYTQANGDQRCVQWQLYQGQLRTRSWSSAGLSYSTVSSWAVIARRLVNSSTDVPFALQGATTPYGSRLIDVRLLVGTSGQPVEVQSSLSGRNTEYGYDPNVCNPIPP